MDGNRFDALTRALGSGRSRRSVVKALGAAALGAVGLSRLGDAAAATRLRSVGNSCRVNGDCASGRCVQEARTRFICHCQSVADCPAATHQCHAAACLPNGYCGIGVTTGAPCTDGNLCTTGDACQADGSCQGAPVVCTASDQCHVAGTCDPATGRCSNPPAPDGSGCNDGNACSNNDQCLSGACIAGGVIVCLPSDACHLGGTCDPASGQCSNPPAPDGTTCPGGSCQSGICQTGGPGDGACTTRDDCPINACYPGMTCLNGFCNLGLVIKPFSYCNEVLCDPTTGWYIGPPIVCDSPGSCESSPGLCVEGQGCLYPSNCYACQTCQNDACVDNCPPSGVACLATNGSCNTGDGLCHYADLCGPCATCRPDGSCGEVPNGTIPDGHPLITCCFGQINADCAPGFCPSFLSNGFPCCGAVIDDTCCNGINVFGHCCPVGSVEFCAGAQDVCCDHECTCSGLGCFCSAVTG